MIDYRVTYLVQIDCKKCGRVAHNYVTLEKCYTRCGLKCGVCQNHIASISTFKSDRGSYLSLNDHDPESLKCVERVYSEVYVVEP